MTIDWKSLSKKKHRYECFLAIALDLCNKILDQFWTINTIILSPPGSSNSKIPPPSPPLPERMSGSEHLASEDRASNSITPNSVEVLSPPCQTSNHKNRQMDPKMESKEFQCNFCAYVYIYIWLHHRNGGEILSFTWKLNHLFQENIHGYFFKHSKKNPRNKWSEDH